MHNGSRTSTWCLLVQGCFCLYDAESTYWEQDIHKTLHPVYQAEPALRCPYHNFIATYPLMWTQLQRNNCMHCNVYGKYTSACLSILTWTGSQAEMGTVAGPPLCIFLLEAMRSALLTTFAAGNLTFSWGLIPSRQSPPSISVSKSEKHRYSPLYCPPTSKIALLAIS